MCVCVCLCVHSFLIAYYWACACCTARQCCARLGRVCCVEQASAGHPLSCRTGLSLGMGKSLSTSSCCLTDRQQASARGGSWACAQPTAAVSMAGFLAARVLCCRGIAVGCWQPFRGCAHLALPAGRPPLGVSFFPCGRKPPPCAHSMRQGRCLHVACCSLFLPAGLAPILTAGFGAASYPQSVWYGYGFGAIACALLVDSCT